MALKFYTGISALTNSLLKLFNTADSHFVSLKAPAALGTDFALVLPGADVTSGALVSDGSGNLSIATIVNANVSASAAIAATKLAVLAAGSIVSVSTNVTLTNQAVHLVDTSSARSLTLPAPSTSSFMVIKDSTGSALTNNITIVRAGSEKIETVAASYVLNYSLGSWTFISNGTDWFII